VVTAEPPPATAVAQAPPDVRRLRIAHVTATFPPYLAGTGNVALHNARSLARRGHQVTVYTAADRGAGKTGRDAEPFELRRLRSLVRIGNAPFMPALMGLRPYDLVHLHYPFIFGAEIIGITSWLKRQPYVITYHNDLAADGIKGVMFDAYDLVWGGRVVRAARRIFVPSLDAAPSSPLLGPIVRAHPRLLTEVPNGVDTRVLSPGNEGAAIRDRLGIPRDAVVLIFVGRMDAAHDGKGGVPVLLEAMTRVKVVRPVAILVGDGDRVADYSALAARLGVGGQAHFVGSIPNDDLAPYFSAADIAVQPSIGKEIFGMAAIEAMACGRPVITSDLPGARRVVADTGGGLLARPGDPRDLAMCIERLVADPPLRRQLAAAGRRSVVDRYDWDHIGSALEEAYLEVLSVSH
jgi:glycosyltransferase involved in cell wall biosynthesis